MTELLAISFEGASLGPAVVNGMSNAAFYALIAIPLVLGFRMTRSIAFVHGGIATLTGVLYWWLIGDTGIAGTRIATREWPFLPALVLVLALGTLLGLGYGAFVMTRLKTWPRIAVTTFSLGAMLFLFGVVVTLWNPDFTVPSPFGPGKFRVLGQFVSVHQVAVAVMVLLIGVGLSLFLNHTRGGTYVRAIADDIEGAAMMGIPVERVGIAVWALAGLLSGTAGVMIVVLFRVSQISVLTVFLRALLVGIVGGFNSIPLVLLGSLLLASVESVMGSGVFGQYSGAVRDTVILAVLFVTVVAVNRARGSLAELLDTH